MGGLVQYIYNCIYNPNSPPAYSRIYTFKRHSDRLSWLALVVPSPARAVDRILAPVDRDALALDVGNRRVEVKGGRCFRFTYAWGEERRGQAQDKGRKGRYS